MIIQSKHYNERLKIMKLSFTRLITLLLTVSLCSCGLLPKEEQPIPPPVLKKYDPAEYNTYRVTKGDIQKIVTISVSYIHAVTETLSFPVGGFVVTNINVSKGDQVKKGDVLAVLDTSDLDGPLRDVRNQIAANKTEIENTDALYKIDKKIAAIVTGTAVQTEINYTKRLGDLEADQKSLELRLQLMEQKESQRYLTAGIDGIVSYMSSLKPGDYCEKDSSVLTIDSGSASVFAASGSNADLIAPGMEVDINVNSVSEEKYRAKASDPAELGITEPQKDTVYLALVDPVNFPNNSYGSIKLIADERKNVLFVPTPAINMVKDKKFVYTLVDNIKTVRDISTGLDAGTYTEITGGLSEGDEIILGNN